MAIPCNPGGKHAYLRAWKSFYSWAQDNDLITDNPCSKVSIKVPKPLRHAVGIEDIPTLLAACQSIRDKLIVSMLADTGLRLSELAGIRLGDMDLPKQTMTVMGKGAKERKVRYGPRTASFLDDYLRAPHAGETLLELKSRGISIMLHRLGKATGIRCNAQRPLVRTSRQGSRFARRGDSLEPVGRCHPFGSRWGAGRDDGIRTGALVR